MAAITILLLGHYYVQIILSYDRAQGVLNIYKIRTSRLKFLVEYDMAYRFNTDENTLHGIG